MAPYKMFCLLKNIIFFHLDVAQFDYVFAENGLVAFKDGIEFKKQVCVPIN